MIFIFKRVLWLILITKKPEFRKEYKFVLDSRQLNSFYKFYDNIFSNLHPSRRIVSLYFDTIDFKLYNKSILNDVGKFKYRFRQYPSISTNISKEIKFNTKKGKEKISDKTNFHNFKDIPNQTYRGFNLIPTLFVDYHREYYEIDKKIRVTIDKKIKFSPSKNRSLISKDNSINNIIVEFKLLSSKIEDVSTYFFTNPVAFSKYEVGIAKTYPNV
tara:strand:+ start:3689 stop:4333 length:645 start_codon:yes stop_codon:yes gene_type:complete